jgi:hypothetical protein
MACGSDCRSHEDAGGKRHSSFATPPASSAGQALARSALSHEVTLPDRLPSAEILNTPDIACLSAQAARIGLDVVKMTSSDQRYTDNDIVGMQRLKSAGRSRGIKDIEHFAP